MKKTAIAAAIGLSLGASASSQAATITITQMVFGLTYAATGTLNDAVTGSVNSVISSFGQPWTADQQAWFDTHSSVLTWSGTSPGSNLGGTYPFEDFTYTFHLTGNQVAAGTFFDWNTNHNIPMLTIFDCPVSGGGTCVGNTLPMVTQPFPGQQPQFNGTTTDDFPVSAVVPVPAAAWLFGSGLIGLLGVARRQRMRQW